MKSKYLPLGFGILVCLSGIGYLALNYFQYLSGIEKLVFVLLWAGMFAFLGKYCGGLWGKAWMPRATGILSLVAGALPLIGLAVFVFSSGMLGQGVMTFLYFGVPWFLFALSVGFAAEAMTLPSLVEILANLLMPLLLIGVLVAVVGGTCALKKKNWWLALAGAIGALICSPLIGIPAIIFVAQAKAGFSSTRKPEC